MGTIDDDMIGSMYYVSGEDEYENDHELVTLNNCRCIKETDLALLVNFDKWGFKQHWIPKSVVHDSSDVLFQGAEGNLVVPQWFCEKNDIE